MWYCFKPSFLLALGLFWSGSFGTLRADDLRQTTSLKYVPADASFYSAILRNREQVDTFLKSNAYQKLRNLPLVAFGLGMLEGQWQNSEREEVRVIKELWEREENQQLGRMLLDAVSQEIFIYGDARFPEVFKVSQEIQQAVRTAQIRAAQNADSGEIQQQLLKSILENLKQFKLPATVVGFRISDAKAAEAQINRLEKFLKEATEQREDLQPLKDRLTRDNIGGVSFLTLSLDGSLIPWDQLPEEAREQIDEDARNTIKRIKLAISLGVKDGYLLISVGDSNEHLKRMGQGELLIDRPELNPMRKHAEQRIVGIGYASGPFMEQVNAAARQIDSVVSNVETVLPLAELGKDATESLLTDVRQLAKELKSFIPKSGAVASFSFLTEHGYEGYSYNWGQNNSIDGSQPLKILDHVGGNPVAFFAARGKYSPEAYDWITKWLGTARQQIEKNVVPKLSDEERRHFEQVRDRALPLLKRFDQVTRDQLMPALRDGQGAVVLDVTAQSKQWHRELPETRIPLPMLELAFVYGVSDPAALKRAGAEYFAITQAALDAIHELAENNVPKIELPSPDRSSTDGGEIFSYGIPEPVGLDAQLAPNAGMSRDTLVLSLFPDQTKRLLKATPVTLVGPLSSSDRPLASASYFNVTRLLDAISPWINYGVRIAGQAQGEDNPQANVAAQMVAGNVLPIVELLKCLGEHASVTYLEGDVLVTHSVSRLVDAK